MTQTGMNFGDYRLLHRLAVGGMAEIFLAVDRLAEPGQQMVVIKRLREELQSRPEYCEMFIDEERVIRRLDHPGIVKVRDFGKVDGRYYMAIEYVWGESLSALTRLCTVQGKQFPLSLAIHIASQVADALAHAHAQRDAQGRPAPVLHRDVTLGNVVISYRGEVKILDFGIAKSADRLSETRAGQLKGTPLYLAPEQIRIGESSPATDIYQLGVLLYHVSVGRPPLSWDSNADLMRQIVAGAIIRPTAWNPQYPPSLERVVLTAMARDPDERFASARELAAVLRQFLAAHPAELRRRLGLLVSALTGNRHAEQESFIAALLADQAVGTGNVPVFSWAFEPRASEEQPLPVRVDQDELTGTAMANRPVAELIREATQREAQRPLPGPSLEPVAVADDEQTRPVATAAYDAGLETTERVERPPHHTPAPEPAPPADRRPPAAGRKAAPEPVADDEEWRAPTRPMPKYDPASAAASIHEAPTRIEQPADSSPPAAVAPAGRRRPARTSRKPR